MKIKEYDGEFDPEVINKLREKVPFHCKLCENCVEDEGFNPPIFCTEVEADDWQEDHYYCDSFKISENKLIDYLQNRNIWR